MNIAPGDCHSKLETRRNLKRQEKNVRTRSYVECWATALPTDAGRQAQPGTAEVAVSE